MKLSADRKRQLRRAVYNIERRALRAMHWQPHRAEPAFNDMVRAVETLRENVYGEEERDLLDLRNALEEKLVEIESGR